LQISYLDRQAAVAGIGMVPICGLFPFFNNGRVFMPSVAWAAYPWPSLRGWFCASLPSFFAFLFPSMAGMERAFASATAGGGRRRNGRLKGCFQALFGTLLLAGLPAGAAGTATTTTLAVTSGGSAVTTVTSGSVVTLTATVMAGTTPVTTGQVKFCDAKATYCEDIHILGWRQLTSAGTAVLKFRPGVGSHSYKAVFVGTKSDAGGTSGTATLTVTHTGLYPTGTTIAQSGSPGNYTLTATVGGVGPLAPTGTVSFLDTSNSNAVLATATLGAGTSGLSFLNSSNPATGTYPIFIAVGDFNGDGIPDLAVANANSDTVTVLLGNGDGTFTATTASPATGGCPDSIAVGDFNGDGIPDLAVAHLCSETVTVLLGNGDGTFTATATSPATGNPGYAIAAGDFNGDGVLDLAMPGEPVLLGNGDGTFRAVAGSALPVGSAIAVGDFNGDGIPDLAVTNKCPTCHADGTVTILLGNGDGTFTPVAASPATGILPASIAVGDFNGDGIPDLAVANECGSDPKCVSGGTVTVLLGNGDGTFTAVPESPVAGRYAQSIAVGDFNGDGIPDLAVGNTGSGTETVLLGNGDGTFTPTAGPAAGGFAYAIAVGDFNGDGIPDLAAGDSGGNTVAVFLTETQTATASASGVAVALGSGAHQVVASYPGGSNYDASTSLPTVLTGTPTPATLTSPQPGSVLPGSSVTFTWTGGFGVTEYQLWLGTTGIGSQNLYNSGSTTATSASVTGLPAYGQTVYATLGSLIGGVWQYANYTYTEAGTPVPAALTSPTPGSTLPGSSATFAWTGGTGPTAYQLWLGTTGVGSQNLYDSGATKATTVTVNTLPTDGVTVFARLWSLINGTWQSIDYLYTESGTLATAALTSPTPGSTLTGSSATFTWTGGSGPAAYELWLGTTRVGSQDLYDSGSTTATSETVTVPANGVTVFARLWSEIDGSWRSADYLYTEAGTPAPAALTSPQPGSTLTGSSVTFTWTGGSGPAAYELWLGTTRVGSQNLYDSGATKATTVTVSDLPTNGVTVYARLWWEIDAVWKSADYIYTAQ
jgi:hypothetical protein